MHLDDQVEEKRRKKPKRRRVENPRIVEECEVGDVVVLGDGRLFRFTAYIAGGLFGRELDPTHGQEGEFETVRRDAKVVLVPDYVRPDVPRPTPPHLIRSLVPRIRVPRCDWIPRGPEPRKLWRASDSRISTDAPSSDIRPAPDTVWENRHIVCGQPFRSCPCRVPPEPEPVPDYVAPPPVSRQTEVAYEEMRSAASSSARAAPEPACPRGPWDDDPAPARPARAARRRS